MTGELLDENGWLHTGDVGVWQVINVPSLYLSAKTNHYVLLFIMKYYYKIQDGCLKIVDRCKHMFKLAQGEYVAPLKLEEIYQRSALVNQIFVDGDAHSLYPVALVFPEVDYLREVLNSKQSRKSGIGSSSKVSYNQSIEDLCMDPNAKELVLADLILQADASNLVGFEKIKHIRLIPEPFTIDNAMLTPTQKTVRNAVRKRYSEELSSLFEEVAAF